MHILQIAMIAHRFELSDGQGRVNYEVALGAVAEGHHVTLVTAHCARRLRTTPGITVVPVGEETLSSQLLRDLAFATASAAWLRRHRGEFDLVQANGFTTWQRCDVVTAHFVHSAWAANPFYPFRGSLQPRALYQRLFTAVNAILERYVFRRAGKVIAVSSVVAHDVQKLGVPADKIEVIQNGVDIHEFHPGASERAAFGLPEQVPLALFVGDIRTTRKNLDTTLHALRRVPGLHLAVAGELNGSPFPALATALGLADRVHFLGKVSRVAALMRSADMFLFPSRYEAHPLVVLEAMASGLPMIVASTVGSVSTFRDCFRVLEDPDDCEGLARLVEELLHDRTLRDSLAHAARARAESLTWERTVKRYLRTYQALVETRACRGPYLAYSARVPPQ